MVSTEGGIKMPSVPEAQIVPVEHFRQRQDAHGSDCRADNASHGRHDEADDHRADRKSAANPAEPELHGRIEIANDVRALQQHGHKDVERNAEQCF
jgi:hypothetical protein